jgi:hypothetical protein
LVLEPIAKRLHRHENGVYRTTSCRRHTEALLLCHQPGLRLTPGDDGLSERAATRLDLGLSHQQGSPKRRRGEGRDACPHRAHPGAIPLAAWTNGTTALDASICQVALGANSELLNALGVMNTTPAGSPTPTFGPASNVAAGTNLGAIVLTKEMRGRLGRFSSCHCLSLPLAQRAW